MDADLDSGKAAVGGLKLSLLAFRCDDTVAVVGPDTLDSVAHRADSLLKEKKRMSVNLIPKFPIHL